MTLLNRAAQFAPFAALAGHGAAIAETARITDSAVEVSDSVSSQLDRKMACLLAHLDEKPAVTVTFFEPDARKEGGSYQTYSALLKRVDAHTRLLTFDDGKRIPLSAVLDLDSPLFEESTF